MLLNVYARGRHSYHCYIHRNNVKVPIKIMYYFYSVLQGLQKVFT